MKAGIVITLLVGLMLIPASAMAEWPDPPPWEFEFTYAAPTGGPTDIPDDSVKWYPVELVYNDLLPTDEITYLELEVVGLTHTRPEDLNFILLDPLAGGIEVMDDAGDGFSLLDITVVYSDKGVALPHSVPEGAILPGPDTIYLPDGPGAFADYMGKEIGTLTAPWIIMVIDDAESDSGSFESVTLRGVPEPVTLSLLAVGALVTLRRRRR